MHIADPSIQDIRLQTPLHFAAESGSAEITELLLQAKANPVLQDYRGKTPVEIAARGNFVTVVDMIIKAERVHSKLIESGSSDEVLKTMYFGRDINVGTEHMRKIIYKLATRKFRRDEWTILARHWNYTETHIKCIEEQYIGKTGFKEHGYRFLLIWLFECLVTQQNPIKEMYEGLVVIERKDLAEQIRLLANTTPHHDSKCSIL